MSQPGTPCTYAAACPKAPPKAGKEDEKPVTRQALRQIMWRPDTRLLAFNPWLVPARRVKLNERSANVYENKGTLQKTDERSGNVYENKYT